MIIKYDTFTELIYIYLIETYVTVFKHTILLAE